MLVYALYLIGGLSHLELHTPIARYFVMSSLTRRYTESVETQIAADSQLLRQCSGAHAYLQRMRDATDRALTDDFWNISLPRDLVTSALNSPVLNAYAASLCLLNTRIPGVPQMVGTRMR